MNEKQARGIAQELIANSNIDPCEVSSIRFVPAPNSSTSDAARDEWVVILDFALPDDVDCSTEFVMVIVDDATGVARFFDTL